MMVMVILPFFVFSPSLGFLKAMGWTVHRWAPGLPEQLRGFGDRPSLSWGCCTPSLLPSRCIRCIQRWVKVWRCWEQCRLRVSSLSEPHTLLQSLLTASQQHGRGAGPGAWRCNCASKVKVIQSCPTLCEPMD